jgi:hypothetical protein
VAINSLDVGIVVLQMVIKHPCTGQKNDPGSDTDQDPDVCNSSPIPEYSSNPGSTFTTGPICDDKSREREGSNYKICRKHVSAFFFFFFFFFSSHSEYRMLPCWTVAAYHH